MAIVCPDCGGPELTYEFIAPAFDPPYMSFPDSYQLNRCERCQLVFTAGVDEKLLEKVYAADYYGSGEQKFNRVIERILAFGAKRRARAITKRWRAEYTSNPAVLDIGCGRGLLLKAFRDAGARVQGLERSFEPVERSLQDAVYVGSLDDLHAASGKYDVAVIWHVLEHIAAPDDVLGSLSDLLQRDALLVITVPNFDSLQRRIFGRYWFHLDLPRHVVHFEAKVLSKKLITAGYKVEGTSFFEPVQSVYGFVQSAMNALVPKRKNRFYTLLKLSGLSSLFQGFELVLWSVLAAVLLPFACIDLLLGVLFRKGATVQFYARFKGTDND